MKRLLSLPPHGRALCALVALAGLPALAQDSATNADYTVVVVERSCVSSGSVLDLVPTPPEDGEQMIGAVRKESRGWFPVQNRLALAPSELEMLQADIATLSNDFDAVFVFMDGGLRKGGSFFDQLLGICEAAILIVGASRTPRSWFGYVRRHMRTVQKPMVAIVTGARAKVIRAEMEAKQ